MSMKLTVDYSESDPGRIARMVEKVIEHTKDLDKIELVPSESNIFRVSLDGKVLFESEEGFDISKIESVIREETDEISGD